MVFLRSLLKVRVSIFSYLGHFPGKIFHGGSRREERSASGLWTTRRWGGGGGQLCVVEVGGNAYSYPRLPAQSPPPRTRTLEPRPQNCMLGLILLLLNFGGGSFGQEVFFCSHCVLSCRYLRPTQDLEGEQKLHVSPKEKDPREAVRPEASPPSHSLECSRQSPAWGRGGVGAAGLAGEAQP